MDRKDSPIEEKYSWEKIAEESELLASKISDNYNPEIALVIACGGWIPGRIIKKFIKIPFYSIGCTNYDENDNKQGQVEFYQMVGIEKIKGKKVIIIDEVCDSGKTLEAVTKRIEEMGAASIRTAVLHKKSSSLFNPDYAIKDVGENWIIYPWE